MATGARRLLIAADVADTRRRLGPTAWSVFEELLITSDGEAGRCVSTASVRSLGERTGLAKGTVARALLRLRHAGLVAHHQSRTAGTFAPGSYELTIPDGITVEDDHV